MFRASGGAASKQPGYLVLTPLRLTSGAYVIVNRGFVPFDRKEQSTRLAGLIQGETKITGLMRQPEARNFFTPADDLAAGTYFTRDPDLIAKHFGLAPAAPFGIDADDTRFWRLAERRRDRAQSFKQSFLLCLDLVRPRPGTCWRICGLCLAKG